MNYSEITDKLNTINQQYAQLCKLQYDFIHQLITNNVESITPTNSLTSQLALPNSLNAVELTPTVIPQAQNILNYKNAKSVIPIVQQREESRRTECSLVLNCPKTRSLASDSSIFTNLGFEGESESTSSPGRSSFENPMECKKCNRKFRSKGIRTNHEKKCRGKHSSLDF